MPRIVFDGIFTGGTGFLLVDAFAKATVLLCLAAFLATVLRHSAAAVRHRLWSLALCGVILLPLLSLAFPGWTIPALPATTGSVATSAYREDRTTKLKASQEVSPGGSEDIPEIRQPTNPSRRATARQSFGTTDDAQRVWGWLISLWLLGFLVFALPVLTAVLRNEWRRRHAGLVLDQNWLSLLDAVRRQLTLHRQVELRTTSEPCVPVTWGVLRPVVLLPDRAEQWPEPTRRLVLLHELTHVKRWDVGYQLIGRLAAAIYWFHPLAWYALHRLRTECECACDDHVVHLGVRRIDYAQQLVDLARALRGTGLSAAVPLTRKTTLEQRIRALLDDRRAHQPLSHGAAKVLLACGLVVLTGLAVVHLGPLAAGQQPGRSPGSAAAVNSARSDPPAPSANGFIHETYTFPITVTGRALDPAGKPVPGAHVYLVSRRADYKRIAETITDAGGRYEFRNVPLPIERANTVTGRDLGVFQVFGSAEGHGFGWRPEKVFYPQPKPANIANQVEHRDPPGHFEAEDSIALDLTLPPPARLAGVIIDDRGKALENVHLEIRECEYLKVIDNVFPGWKLDALNETDSVPTAIKVRTTDTRGRFEFNGLPVDCRFWIHVRAKNFPWRSFFAATTDGPQPDHDGAPVLTGEIKLVMETAIDVPIKMVFGDTGTPAPKVAVQAAAGLVNVLETTDGQGQATLRLPPGKYRMENLPARGTPYLVTEGELIVGTTPSAKPFVASLRPAGIVEVTVLDAETGAGIPDVDVWQAAADGRRERLVYRSWEVATRIAWAESPRTDEHGKLRALVEPGKLRIGVGLESYPRSHEVVEAGGQDLECRPGETVSLKFTLRKHR